MIFPLRCLLWLWLPAFALFANMAFAQGVPERATSLAGPPGTPVAGAQARLDPGASSLTSTAMRIKLDLALSQPVPFRLRMLPGPPRLVLDFNTLDWSGAGTVLDAPGAGVRAVRSGHLPDGWARLVLDLAQPFIPEGAGQSIDPATGAARITVTLGRADADDFDTIAHSEAALIAQSDAALLHPADPPARPQPARRPVVMLDPGHGGIDPGAERDGFREADLVLSFARELREILLRRGAVDVALSRDDDIFISLEGRIRAARAIGADLLVSLHADAVPDGMASGTMVYTLAPEASDDSAAYLAERLDRGDLLAGVDLSAQDDAIARVLMNIAWLDTQPRNAALAQQIVDSLAAAGKRLHTRPLQSGRFTVLRAQDMPSVLIELGFMSNPAELAALRDSAWRAGMANALADAIEAWFDADAASAQLRGR